MTSNEESGFGTGKTWIRRAGLVVKIILVIYMAVSIFDWVQTNREIRDLQKQLPVSNHGTQGARHDASGD
jgi:hypothetical protein